MFKRMIILALIVLVLSACTGLFSRQTPAPTDTLGPIETLPPSEIPTEALPSETPSSEPSPTLEMATTPMAFGPHEFPANVSPLTGLLVQDQTRLERRPVAVKIQLFPRSGRPPIGVSSADIVYDYYQNFGLTRLHAIFLSQDSETVGPVRSARLLDQQLVHMYNSIFAFGSAEQRTYSRLFGSDFASRLVVEGQANCPPMCRIDPNGRNELVANTLELSNYVSGKGVDNVRQNLDGMYFNPAIPAAGQQGTQVFVRFSISAYNLWDFNPEIGRYLRYQDTQEAQDQATESTQPLLDRLTNEQIAADNVIVLLAPYSYAFGTKPGVNEVVDIDLNGSGPAYAFRDGQVFQVVWNRPARNGPLFLTFQDGSIYPYKPGNTWYEVVGKSTKLETPFAGHFRFPHRIP